MNYVIIGAGPAGIIAAETLRQSDAGADITVVSHESEQPYSRMALPYFLTGNIDEKGTYLRKRVDHFSSLNIQLLYRTVEHVDTVHKSLRFSDNSTLSFDKLLIASGSRPVKPSITGIDFPNIYNCWTLSDARIISEKIRPGTQVVLLGAGFIGCIILEALVKQGAHLTVVEMGDRMVPRMMNEKAGNLIKAWCLDKGISVLTETCVEKIMLTHQRQLQITCNDNLTISADCLVSAVGVRPNIDFLKHCNIMCGQGILVNRSMQTNVADIYAAGDVAQGLDFSTGEYSVQAIQPTAAEHALIAARNMSGQADTIQTKGFLNMNVLDTLGLISSSFGSWMGVENGESTELYDPDNYRYLNLQFSDDRLVGATSIGLTQHIGVIKGLIKSQCRLGQWKTKLINNPSRLMEAYLATTLLTGQ